MPEHRSRQVFPVQLIQSTPDCGDPIIPVGSLDYLRDIVMSQRTGIGITVYIMHKSVASLPSDSQSAIDKAYQYISFPIFQHRTHHIRFLLPAQQI